MPTLPKPDTDRLIETFRSYANAIAGEVMRKFPGVDRDDLRGAAQLGLVEAANSFDASRGVLFKTFAYYRIRGAMYDSLRKMGWLSKDPARLRFESGANEYMKDYSDSPSPGGTAEESCQELEDITSSVLNCYFLSLSTMKEELPEQGAESPEQNYHRREMAENIRKAMAKLPPKNRQVLEDYYFKDETLEAIGQRLGLSKSWVSRLHAKGLDMMKSYLQEAGVSKAVPG